MLTRGACFATLLLCIPLLGAQPPPGDCSAEGGWVCPDMTVTLKKLMVGDKAMSAAMPTAPSRSF